MKTARQIRKSVGSRKVRKVMRHGKRESVPYRHVLQKARETAKKEVTA